jgi:hypothetical protein
VAPEDLALDWSAVFHQMSVWLFRLAIAAGLVGVAFIYMKKQATPPGAPGSSVQETAIGSCQPIGHTASGKLIYSMDCDELPAADAAPAAADK